MTKSQSPFADPALVSTYADDTPLKVPGLADLHRMAMLLISEQAPDAADILVIGAGGGLELQAMAEARRDWTFTGVDPSRAMLDLARGHTQPFGHRISWVEGVAEDAPPGPFDGATCLLTLHFLEAAERRRTLAAIHDRLKPGGRLIVAHHAAPGGDAERWLARSAAFANRGALDWERARASAKAMAERLPLSSCADEEQLLQEAGFIEVALFYAAFSFRGWVATAAPTARSRSSEDRQVSDTPS